MLLPHNQTTYQKIENTLNKNHDLCIVQGTGTGKSYLFMELAKNRFHGKEILYILPKHSIAANLRRYREFKEIEDFITFRTYNWFRNEENTQKALNSYDVFFIDEAHHLGSAIYGKNLQELLSGTKEESGKYFIGMTATPLRDADGYDVTEMFSNTVNGLSTLDCIEQGLMPPIEYLVCQTDMTAAEKKLYRARLDVQNSGQLLRSIIKDNLKKHWLCYFATIEALEETMPKIKKLFPKHKVVRIAGDKDRTETVLSTLKTDENYVILSVDKLLEGIHLPETDGILLFRNVHSLTVFSQILGRVSSIGSTSIPLVIDCTDTAMRLFKKLYAIEKEQGPTSFSGAPRKILYVSLKNKKYFDITSLLANMRSREVEFRGIVYPNLAECCRQVGAPYDCVMQYAARHGITIQETLEGYLNGTLGMSPKQEFQYQGKTYKTFEDCCTQFGLVPNSVKVYGKKHKISITDALVKSIEMAAKRNASRVLYKGKAYASIAEACKALGLQPNTIRNNMKQHKISFQEAVKKYYKDMDKRFKYNGKIYASWDDCLKSFGLSRNTVDNYAYRKRISKKEALDHYVGEGGFCLMYRGSRYMTLKQCADSLGLPYHKIVSRKFKHNLTTEEALDYYYQQKYGT